MVGSAKRRSMDLTLGPPSRRLRLRVEPMHPRDLNEVLGLEQASFPSPWSRRMFLEEFDRSFAILEVARLLDEEGTFKLVGYSDFWLVYDEVHLLSIAVDPGYRGFGVGSMLLGRICDASRKIEARQVILEVRPSNEPARRLYRKMGFTEIGVRRKYYKDTGEDALVMALKHY